MENISAQDKYIRPNYSTNVPMASLQHLEVTNALHLLAEVSATRTAEILDHQQSSQNANVESDK